MLSYKNDPKLKKDFVAEVVKHRKADQIVQGTYGEKMVHGKVVPLPVLCALLQF